MVSSLQVGDRLEKTTRSTSGIRSLIGFKIWLTLPAHGYRGRSDCFVPLPVAHDHVVIIQRTYVYERAYPNFYPAGVVDNIFVCERVRNVRALSNCLEMPRLLHFCSLPMFST